MKYRTLGRTGIQVSAHALGAMMFGAIGNPDHDESLRIIGKALDSGINVIDTADVYSNGESEEIVGKAVKGRSERAAFEKARSREKNLMRNLLRRSTIATLAAAPIAAMTLFGAEIGSAAPLNCGAGQFWDPITNTCQTPRPADDCAPGQYWNALSNVCRPLGQL